MPATSVPGSRKTTRKVPVSHETSPLLDASSSSLQYAGGSFSSGLTPGSGSSSQVLHNGVTPRLPTSGHDQYTPSMDSLPRSVPNTGRVRNRPNSEEAQSVDPEMQGGGSVFHGADNGRDVENGTDYLSEGMAASPLPSPPRLKGTLSGRMTWQKAGSRVSESDAWRFKYHQFMADMPALDNSTFGAGKREFYRRQRDMLEGFQAIDEALKHHDAPLTAEEEVELQRIEKGEALAVELSNYVNLILLVAKVYACFVSGSLAVIASALDSLLDLVAGFILWFTARQMSTHQPDKFPTGKKRMQPVGIIVFAAIMATLGLQILLEGLRQLVITGAPEHPLSPADMFWTVLVLGVALGVKWGLYLYCIRFPNEIVHAYATDHLFDVLTNGMSLGAALLGNYLLWYLDPLGAILISIYTITNWGNTVLENAVSLVGATAPPDYIGRLTYLVFNHDQRILKILKIQAWTFGSLYWVEIDIQFREDILLREAQEVGEALKRKVESLAEVERAFIQLFFRDPSRTPTPSLICNARGT